MNRPPSSSQSPEVAATLSLRERAEALFRKSEGLLPETIGSLTPDKVQEILHELRVHQIELEMQTEELLRSQVELDKSRALYFDLYDLAPVGYCTVSDKGQILQANLTAATMLGIARSGLIRSPFSSCIRKEDQDIFYLSQKMLAATGELQSCDLRMIRPDGTAFFAHLQITSATDENGAGICRVALIDVTRHRLAEQALQKLRTAVEQSANTIVITDPGGNIEYVNPAFEKSTGYTAAEVIGQNPRLLKSGLHERPFYCHLWATITSGKIWRGEFQNKRKDGTLYWESATISPVVDTSGEIAAFIAVKEDVTDRKAMDAIRIEAMEQTVAANRVKSDFLAIMSHELRTPLNGVLGFAELLSGTPLNQEQRDFARIISESGNHLLQVVNDILDFSSIEKGHLPLESAPILVADLLESAVAPSKKTAADKGLNLLCEMAPDLPEKITGDVRRIRQILINLIGNAVKFTSRGSVVVRVARSGQPESLRPERQNDGPVVESVTGFPACETAQTQAGKPVTHFPASRDREDSGESTARGESFLDFSIEDTGHGIHPEAIGLLFKPFVQEDMTLHRPFEGTGLGLAISQRLAEAMGGTITVISAVDQGSTFTLRLPVVATAGTSVSQVSDAPLPPASSCAQAGTTPAPPEPRPVLVVEDDASNSDLAGKMLNALGFRAEFAFDGQQAVQAFEPGKFFAILMDMQMPVMDGLTATGKIREIEGPSGARVPVIALTANVMPGDRERCLAAGMDDFLSKPFNKAGLAAKLAGLQPPPPNIFPARS